MAVPAPVDPPLDVGLDLFAGTATRRTRAQRGDAGVVGVGGTGPRIGRVRQLRHAPDQRLPPHPIRARQEPRVRRIAVPVVGKLVQVARGQFVRVAVGHDAAVLIHHRNRAVVEILQSPVRAARRSPAVEVHPHPPVRPVVVAQVAGAGRDSQVVEIHAPVVTCLGGVSEIASDEIAVVRCPFEPPAVSHDTLRELIDEAAADVEEVVQHRHVAKRQARQDRAGVGGHRPVAGSPVVPRLAGTQVQPQGPCDGRVIVLAQVVVHEVVDGGVEGEELAFVHVGGRVGGPAGRRIAVVGIGDATQVGQDLVTQLAAVGQLTDQRRLPELFDRLPAGQAVPREALALDLEACRFRRLPSVRQPLHGPQVLSRPPVLPALLGDRAEQVGGHQQAGMARLLRSGEVADRDVGANATPDCPARRRGRPCLGGDHTE